MSAFDSKGSIGRPPRRGDVDHGCGKIAVVPMTGVSLLVATLWVVVRCLSDSALREEDLREFGDSIPIERPRGDASHGGSVAEVLGGTASTVAILDENPVRRVMADRGDATTLPGSVRRRLSEHGETEAVYLRYLAQTEETRTILSSLVVCRFFEELRPARFDASRYVDEVLTPRYEVTTVVRDRLRENLASLCRELMGTRREIWAAYRVTADRRSSAGFGARCEADLRERRAWQELERRIAPRLEASDRAVREWLGISERVLARPRSR